MLFQSDGVQTVAVHATASHGVTSWGETLNCDGVNALIMAVVTAEHEAIMNMVDEEIKGERTPPSRFLRVRVVR